MKCAVLGASLCFLCLSSISKAANPNPQSNSGSPIISTKVAKVSAPAICLPGHTCQTAPKPFTFLLPLFLSNQDFKSTAVIVNSNSVATYVDVTVRDADGNVAAQQRVNISAHNHVQIDISELLDSVQSKASAGSVLIAPATDGTGNGVIGQMSIMYKGSSEPSYLEFEPSRPSPSNSLVLRAVAEAGQGSPIVGITSVAASPQHVTVECSGSAGPAFSKMVTVPPMGTFVTPACSNVQGDPLAVGHERRIGWMHSQAEGISLTTDASPGSFTALGFAPHRQEDKTFLTPVLFSDPQGVKTSTTIFGGLPVGHSTLLPGGDYVPELSAANFSNSAAHLTVSYSQTTGDTPEVKTVTTLIVPPGGTATARLTGLQGDSEFQNSFEVVSDQAPGEVVDNISSKSDTGVRWVELPGKDMDNSHDAGNHPWTIADGTNSTILLFNEASATENFTVRVASGQAVWTKKYSLAALATKAIDINELIQDQVNDDKGNVLPIGLQTGEANWFTAKQFGGTGRLLQSNPAEFAARSFSCGEYAVITGADWYPYDTSEDVGQENELGELDAQVSLTESSGCYGDYVGDSNDYFYDWSSENTSIATVSGGGYGYYTTSFTGISGGTTTIDGTVDDDYGCSAGSSQDATITDDQTPVITDINPSVWPAGQTTQVTFSGQNLGSNQPTLSYSDSTITTQSYSSYSDSQIVAYVNVPSGTPSDEEVEVTVANNGYGGNLFYGGGQNSPGSGSATATIGGGTCFAQLKYRPVYIGGVNSGKNHSFWYIQDSNGTQWTIDAGPSSILCPASCGNLIDWITQGTVGHYAADNSGAAVAWYIGPSSGQLCSQVSSLYSYAQNWTPVPYVVDGAPNSNTFSHDAGTAAGFTNITAPPNAPGW